jgi:hypothetical protein
METKKPGPSISAISRPSARPSTCTTWTCIQTCSDQVSAANSSIALRRWPKDWPVDAIRLDAYDGPSGAGSFYKKCGIEKLGHVVYRGVPLVYYEFVL